MSNNISFSPINFNLYISNNNNESDYVYVTLPTNASNNAPLLKYKDHYFVPFSVSCVKKEDGQYYIVIETKCEETKETFYLCTPLNYIASSTDSIARYLIAANKPSSTTVYFDTKDIFPSDRSARISNNGTVYTCIFQYKVDTNIDPNDAVTKTTNIKNSKISTLDLNTSGDLINFNQTALIATLDCQREGGQSLDQIETKIEDTSDKIVNRTLMIIGFIILAFIMYGLFFDLAFEVFFYNLLIVKEDVIVVGYYFMALMVIFGVSMLLYSFAYTRTIHMYLGFSSFILIGVTRYLFNKSKYNDPRLSTKNLRTFNFAPYNKVWLFLLAILLLAMFIIAMMCSVKDFFGLADSSVILMLLLSFTVFCFPFENQGSIYKFKDTGQLAWIRFILMAAVTIIIVSISFTIR